jgi:hypothetical protein
MSGHLDQQLLRLFSEMLLDAVVDLEELPAGAAIN